MDRTKAAKVRQLINWVEALESIIENLSKQPDKVDDISFGSAKIGRLKRDYVLEMLNEKLVDQLTKLSRES